MLPMQDIDRRLPTLLPEVMKNPGYRERARQIQSIYAGLNGPDLCAEAILEYVDGPAMRAASH